MHTVPRTIEACAAFAGLPLSETISHGLTIEERDGLGICSVLARKGRVDALRMRLQQCFGIELPGGPRRTIAGDVSLLGVAPLAWVAMHERAGNAFAASLREIVGDVAAVVDQSDGYAVLHLSGTKVRHALARLLPLDVHPQVLRIGDVAASVIGRMSVTIWRLEDDATGSSVFGTSIFRSFAGSYWQALRESVAETARGDR